MFYDTSHQKNELFFLGYASGIAGADERSAEGPLVMQHSPALAILEAHGLAVHWEKIFQPAKNNPSKLQAVARLCQALADTTARLVKSGQRFIVLGGDHTSAIGTVSGIATATGMPPGLLWIDAHMDSHTPATSHTGNIHGMPLACLLGYGDPALTHLSTLFPVIQPEYLCLAGVRSFEPEEAALLEKLNVRVFFMEEIHARGVETVLAEAREIVSKAPGGYCITLDIDSIDPADAPGTGVREPNGIRAEALCRALDIFAQHPWPAGIEIVEFDPHLDEAHRTENLIPQLILALTGQHHDSA